MGNWLLSNMGTIVICLILAGVVAAILVSLVKKRRRGGGCGCGCGCSEGCPHCGKQEEKI